jgi:hypothetical protein
MPSDATSLCPRFKQVEEFGPDEEYEDEETFYAQLLWISATSNPRCYQRPQSIDLLCVSLDVPDEASLIQRTQGLDTPSPFLQLSGTIFKGQHDSLLGTEILFTDAKGI